MEKDDQTVPDVLKKLAGLLGTEIKDRKLIIPSQFGSGYCSGFIFNQHMRMLISNYELNEDIQIKNSDLTTAKKMIFFKFQNVFPDTETLQQGRYISALPSVLIGTSRINTDEVISIHSNTATINIETDASYLNGLFQTSEQSPLLQSLLQNTQPFLFEQMIYPSLQRIVDEIISEQVDETFKLFFLRVKAEELICNLLMELEKREEKRLYALNSKDVEAMYKVKEKILEHLEIPPIIQNLATEAGMSPTKLKRLFKQIFGSSIFSYYQEFRMKEAAFLLKEKKYAVSEVGYLMGFTNLSHFSKVFKEHFGLNPKQYSMIS
ncbi:AraC family transcriptional regulator [Chryseobacterium lactis]|uniref:AraC family transcriptional regulator n=1 Tax=Chryseobacterium lactis TaxID=1241981 RepID=A0A3G6RII5_CHRLC|nr:AraC family transcriptional regulator [Chryseobacterium lactis]AZA83298.1 AraC family transcriptional regulator [Chryseobacterium lactis]AZB03683.1 AraC family transcriptional regulator [Chryseobacterium lactis]PNW11109.1 AraC family transcriptional regulator [Chryseobacterium lactis]